MEPPLPPSAPPLSTVSGNTNALSVAAPPATPASCADSIDSSPRSRTTDGWEDPAASAPSAVPPSRLRLMCSYDGHIVPRPHDKSLCYVGGDTRIVVVERNVTLASLTARLANTLLNGRAFTLKYQLPSEDLDSLISVTTDEDLDNMIEEYDRTISSSTSNRPSRLRLFLFPLKPESTQSMGPILEGSAKSEDWFLNALNGDAMLNRGFSDSTSVNCLLGLDDDGSNSGVNLGGNLDLSSRDGEGSIKSAKQHNPNHNHNQNHHQQGGQDVHSVPDSPMLDTTSSFGSTSSSPSLVNLPPIRVHVEDGAAGGVKVQDQKVGMEDQFAQINLGGVGMQQHQHQDDGLFAISSPPPMPATISVPGLPVNSIQVSSENINRVYSDDERSDHGVPIGFRKPPTPHSQPHNPPQTQLRSNVGPDLPSPDSVSSDSSLNNPLSRQKPVIYQEQVVQIPSASNMVANNPVDPKVNLSDPNTRFQIQESGYVLQPQFEQQQTQTQTRFVAAQPHYVHHHPTGGAVTIPAYIPVYASQQQHLRHHPQLDQQFPVYYVAAHAPTPASAPGRQPPPYSLSVQQPGSISEAPGASSNRTQNPPSTALMATVQAGYTHARNAPASKPELAAGLYRTAQAPGGQQLVQVPTSQQFVGYTQIHQPVQSVVAQAAGGKANYGYEFSDPSHGQIYFTQPLSHAQYQTMTPGATMIVSEGTAGQISTESMEQHIRSSQPL